MIVLNRSIAATAPFRAVGHVGKCRHVAAIIADAPNVTISEPCIAGKRSHLRSHELGFAYRQFCQNSSPSSASSAKPRANPTAGALFSDRKFSDLDLDCRLLSAIDSMIGLGSKLTLVQDAVFDKLVQKDNKTQMPDVLMRAQTGTGKTLAFLLPAIQRLLNRNAASQLGAGVAVIVLAPNRELVLQLSRVCRGLLERIGPTVRSSFVTGGFALKDDVARLKADAPHVLFATPGRLAQHLEQTPNFVRALGSVDLVVVDEADLLLESHLRVMDYIIRCLPSSPTPPKVVLCSATFSDCVRRFASRSLRAGLESVDVQQESSQVGTTRSPTEISKGCVPAGIDQILIKYEPRNFMSVFLATVARELSLATSTSGHEPDSKGRALVLFPSARWVQFFYVLLKHQIGIRNLWAYHRDLPPEKRRAVAALFTSGASQVHGVLLSTDIATRGLDFNVHAVIQVGHAFSRDIYVHRAGRTGRMGAAGRSLILVNSMEEAAVRKELSDLPIREETPERFERLVDGLSALPEDAMAKLDGWWESPQLSNSGKYFFDGVLFTYMKRQETYRVSAETIVRLVAEILRSTGYPKTLGLPAISPALAKRIREQDPLLDVRVASAKERWSAMSERLSVSWHKAPLQVDQQNGQ